jgi:hypothetical protein
VGPKLETLKIETTCSERRKATGADENGITLSLINQMEVRGTGPRPPNPCPAGRA